MLGGGGRGHPPPCSPDPPLPPQPHGGQFFTCASFFREFLYKILPVYFLHIRLVDVPSIVEAEHDKNEVRKDFTQSERVAIGKAIEEIIGERRGRPPKPSQNVENFPQIPEGAKTRDIAAKKAGYGNPKTYEQAKKVVETAEPELVEAMDAGKVSVSAAARLADVYRSQPVAQSTLFLTHRIP